MKKKTFLGLYQTDQGPLAIYGVGAFRPDKKFIEDFGNTLSGFVWCKDCQQRRVMDKSCSYCRMMKEVIDEQP